MTLLVPSVSKKVYLEGILNEVLTLKLYSNNKIPAVGDTAASYTEVTGGGYISKSLGFEGWTITEASPSVATYAFQNFSFTGVTDAPSTIYGYFVVNASGVLRWAERFEESSVPFEPIAGSLIRVTPRFDLGGL